MKPVVLALLVALTPAVHAGDMGRVFFTPEQRDLLQRQLAADKRGTASATVMHGMVQKNGGARTVWIHGAARAAPAASAQDNAGGRSCGPWADNAARC